MNGEAHDRDVPQTRSCLGDGCTKVTGLEVLLDGLLALDHVPVQHVSHCGKDLRTVCKRTLNLAEPFAHFQRALRTWHSC